MSPNEDERDKERQERKEKTRNVVGATRTNVDNANKTENAVKPTMNDAMRTNVDNANKTEDAEKMNGRNDNGREVSASRE